LRVARRGDRDEAVCRRKNIERDEQRMTVGPVGRGISPVYECWYTMRSHSRQDRRRTSPRRPLGLRRWRSACRSAATMPKAEQRRRIDVADTGTDFARRLAGAGTGNGKPIKPPMACATTSNAGHCAVRTRARARIGRSRARRHRPDGGLISRSFSYARSRRSHHADAEVFDQHVGAAHETQNDVTARRLLEVDRDAQLVAIERCGSSRRSDDPRRPRRTAPGCACDRRRAARS